jgi:hypothetical protein
MCYFITAILPSDANLDRMRELAHAHHLKLEAVHNPHVKEQLKPNEHQYVTTMGHCDCGTMIGAATRQESHHAEPNIQRKIKSFKDQGWSASKVDRWIRQHEQMNDRKDRVRKDRVRDWSGECNVGIEEWLSFLHNIRASKAAKYICVLLHHFSGGFDDEPIQLSGRHRLAMDEANHSDFLNMEQDALYEFYV